MGLETSRLLYEMLRIRRIEERVAALYAEQEMRCPVHFAIGQEGVAVGVCAALESNDYVMSGHRSHAHYLAKGGSLSGMIAEFYGRETGCCGGIGGSMHLIDLKAGFLGSVPIVGSTIAIATGVSLASVMRREPRVTVVFFGEGATEEGVFYESVNFAALKNLPIVFLCENNLYSVYSPVEVRQPPSRDLMTIAAGLGAGTFRGDGNDVAAVAAATSDAVKRARSGGGPSVLEFSTYRWLEHCGPNYDNHIGYRTPAEFESWKGQCPIERLTLRLGESGWIDDAEIARMEARIAEEIEDAVRFAKASPFPTSISTAPLAVVG